MLQLKHWPYKSLLLLSALLCSPNYELRANTVGFGIRGGWGLNFGGFSGVYNSKLGVKHSLLDSGQLFPIGVFLEYNFGEDNKESFSVGLDLDFKKRSIKSYFSDTENSFLNNYYANDVKLFHLDCIDAVLRFLFTTYSSDNGNSYSFYLGGGGYYMIRAAGAGEDIEPTALEYAKTTKDLSRFNLLATAGVQAKFLDKILALSLGGLVSFLNQVKADSNDSSLKLNYGDNVSLGQYQIGALAEIRIDVWQIIIG